MAIRNPFRSKSDDEVTQEIGELRGELSRLRRDNARLRDAAHEGVETSLAHARERFAQIAANARLSWGVDPRPFPELTELAAAWATTQPGFAEALHASIDGPPPLGGPDFSKLTKAEFEHESDRLQREIKMREIDLERRGATRRKEEAEAELAGVEERAAEVLGAAP